MDSKKIKFTASCFGASGVIAGAFGAHALAERLGEGSHKQRSWSTATTYCLLHAVAALAVAENPAMRKAATCWLAGTALFSGSIYLLCLDTGLPKFVLGPTTPVGGILMISGWVLAAVAALK